MFVEYSCLPALDYSFPLGCSGVLTGGSGVKNLPAKEVQLVGWEKPLEKEMAIHSSILAWEIPWTEEPNGLLPIGVAKESHTT